MIFFIKIIHLIFSQSITALVIIVHFFTIIIAFRMIPNTAHEFAPQLAEYALMAFYLSVVTVSNLLASNEDSCILYLCIQLSLNQYVPNGSSNFHQF